MSVLKKENIWLKNEDIHKHIFVYSTSGSGKSFFVQCGRYSSSVTSDYFDVIINNGEMHIFIYNELSCVIEEKELDFSAADDFIKNKIDCGYNLQQHITMDFNDYIACYLKNSSVMIDTNKNTLSL